MVSEVKRVTLIVVGIVVALVFVISLAVTGCIDEENMVPSRANARAVTEHVEPTPAAKHCVVAEPPIPPGPLRKSGLNHFTTAQYKESARSFVRALHSMIAFGAGSRNLGEPGPTLLERYSFDGKTVLDFGVGEGRMLYGLQLEGACYAKYVGVDVDASCISWLSEQHPDRSRHDFIAVNTQNARYNPHGSNLPEGEFLQTLQLQAYEQQFDVIQLRSVFTHMLFDDIVKHLTGLSRLLRPGTGVMVVSLYVRQDSASAIIPHEGLENPSKATAVGALHTVLIRKDAFEQAVFAAGVDILLETTYQNQQTYVLGGRARVAGQEQYGKFGRPRPKLPSRTQGMRWRAREAEGSRG